MTETELEKLYKESYKAVYWTAINLLKNKEDAEDIIQDTYVTAYKAYDSLDDKTKAVAWIKKIAANKCLNVLKSRRTFVAEDEFFENEEAVGEDFLPASLVESDEKRKIIMDIVRKCLSEDAYITVILYYFNNMTTGEISEQLGIPQGTVLSRLDYARKKIKKEVTKYEKDNDDKLFAMGIPFLTLLFEKEAESVQFKPIPPAIKNISASQNIAAAAHTAAEGGKNIMIRKLLISAAALVLAGGTAVAVFKVTYDNKKDTSAEKVDAIEETVKGPDSNNSSSEAAIGLSDAADTEVSESSTQLVPAYRLKQYSCSPEGDDMKLTIERLCTADNKTIENTRYNGTDIAEHVTYEYDDQGRLIKSWRYSYQGTANSYTETEYGEFGKIKTVSYDVDNDNAINYVVNYFYDDQGRVIRSEQGDGTGFVYSTHTFEYNADGSYVEYQETDGINEVFYYDSEDRCLEDYSYYTIKNESGEDEPKEFHRVYTYDGQNKIKIEQYEDGVLTDYQTYDYTDSPVEGVWSSSTAYSADGTPAYMLITEFEPCN
ncbi:MAG: sigma-70 family RNA polymerase sigma factor [Clostridiales bacterium]|nr:sigma-70 family RNA polymerase sigma factor [Clostridiales bacterium]